MPFNILCSVKKSKRNYPPIVPSPPDSREGAASARRVGHLLALAAFLTCFVANADPIPQPTPIPIGTTHLDELGDYYVKASYFDGTSVQYPYGWVGESDPFSGMSCTPHGTQGGKRAFLLQPPWRGKPGGAVQQFRLTLPTADSIILRFGIAMRESSVNGSGSGGVVCEVDLNGKPILDQPKADATWTEWRSDLTDYAGQTITLTFKVDPGTAHNAINDEALWLDRRLIVAGGSTPIVPVPVSTSPLPDLTSETKIWDGCSPNLLPSNESDAITFTTVDNPQRLEPAIAKLKANLPNQSIMNMASSAHFIFCDSTGRLISSNDPQVSCKVARDIGRGSLYGGWPQLRSDDVEETVRYSFAGRVATVNWMTTANNGDMRVTVTSSDPYIAAVDFGTLGPFAFRRMVHVPYYGQVWYLPQNREFANSFLDYTKSNASEIDGTTAIYRPMTNGIRNCVSETAYYCVSPHLADVLPTPANAPSPYRADLGDRVVYDVSSTSPFVETAAYLRDMATYGLSHFAVIVHQWQNGGFDNAYPDVLPANTDQGGDEGVRELASAAHDMDSLFALHENYEDFYENAKSFSMSDVALGSNGFPLPSWKNKAQSYAYKPSAIARYAEPTAKTIHAHLHTSAGFVDVSSSVEPWFHVDYNAVDPGAAEFATGYHARATLFVSERLIHSGPVFGEGKAHWFTSGQLDGVDAQSDYHAHDEEYGAYTPLLVDFDLLKIHPLQLNYGMGYFSRWVAPLGAPDGTASPSERDRYRMQEIAFGHAAYVSPELTRDLPFVWQEANLVAPVAARYATASAKSISYDVNSTLVSTDDAIAANSAFDRVHVVYDNGLQIWANSRADNWSLADQSITLPQNGWLAVAPDLTAYTGLREGREVDYCETPNRIFAGTRSDPTTGPPDGVIDYGKVATDGSFSLTRIRPGAWSLVAVPRTSVITVRLNSAAIDSALGAYKVEAFDVTGKDLGAITVTPLLAGWSQFRVNTVPGATKYVVSSAANAQP